MENYQRSNSKAFWRSTVSLMLQAITIRFIPLRSCMARLVSISTNACRKQHTFGDVSNISKQFSWSHSLSTTYANVPTPVRPNAHVPVNDAVLLDGWKLHACYHFNSKARVSWKVNSCYVYVSTPCATLRVLWVRSCDGCKIESLEIAHHLTSLFIRYVSRLLILDFAILYTSSSSIRLVSGRQNIDQ